MNCNFNENTTRTNKMNLHLLKENILTLKISCL